MFGFSATRLNSSLLAIRHDADQERAAPALPRKILLPRYRFPAPQPVSWTAESHPNVPKRFNGIRRPSDIGEEHLKILNVSWSFVDCPEQICHPASLPPLDWLELPETPANNSTPGPRLSDGRAAPQHRDFYARVKEFQIPNHVAYSALSRKPKEGDPPAPRLSHGRRFWEALDESAYYWDTSLDCYIPPSGEEPEGDDQVASPTSPTGPEESNAEAAAQGGSDDPPQKKKRPSPVTPSAGQTQSSFSPFAAISSSSKSAVDTSFRGGSAAPAVAAPGLPRGTKYTGHRVSSSSDVPLNSLPSLLRGFMEPVAWAHGLSVTTPRRSPSLKVGRVLWPVRLTYGIYRPDADRVRARAGWLKGPIMGIRCADSGEGWFGEQIIPKELEGLVEQMQINQDQGDGLAKEDEVVELVRDLGVLLLLAQERAREKGWDGKRPGEGEWWTTRQRWGGGPGGEMGEGLNCEDAKNRSSEAGDAEGKPASADTKAQEAQAKAQASADKRKQAALETWKILRPGQPYWDPKTAFEAIGKPDEEDWDEVFLISAVHTHVSVLRLRVHRAYVEFLTSGTLPNPIPGDSKWCQPTLKRTRWFDLFNMDDRIEAVRTTWGVLSWLTRSKENADVEMNGA